MMVSVASVIVKVSPRQGSSVQGVELVESGHGRAGGQRRVGTDATLENLELTRGKSRLEKCAYNFNKYF